jgi:hypothetical protein
LVENLDTKHQGTFNIATENLTIIDLANKIQSITHCEVKTTESKFVDDRSYNAIVTKARQAGILPENTERDIIYGATQIKHVVEQNRVNNLNNTFYSNAKHLVQILKDYTNNTINK